MTTTPISEQEAFDASLWTHKHDGLLKSIIVEILRSNKAVDLSDVASELATRTRMNPGEEINRIVASFSHRHLSA